MAKKKRKTQVKKKELHPDTLQDQSSGRQPDVVEILSMSRQIRDTTYEGKPELETKEERVFSRCLRILNQAGIPYVVGAAFARNIYTGIWRTTKDLDLFITPHDLKPALDLLAEKGFQTSIEFQHWLAKAYFGEPFVDLIFGSGHGNLQIDRSWIDRGRPAEILGIETRILGVEEMIAMAVYVAERNRFDGAEVAHLIRGTQGQIDWERVEALLGDNIELLLWHLVFFDFIYPGHHHYLPKELMNRVFSELQERWVKGDIKETACLGTVLDPFSFAVSIDQWDYQDSRRLDPLVNHEGETLKHNT